MTTDEKATRGIGAAGGDWMSPGHDPGLASVIIPTYNRARLIGETLDSVFAQTYRPIEVIVVDDGSTDDTEEVARRYEAKTKAEETLTLHYIRQENAGAPAARNRGMRESKGGPAGRR